MNVETFFWAAAVFSSAVLAAAVWPAIGGQFEPGLAERIARWGRWLGSAGLLYLAILTGGISERAAGLAALELNEDPARGWATRLAWAALIVILGAALRRWRPVEPAGLERAAQDECRWAFYRGAAGSVLGTSAFVAGLGLLAASAEWGLVRLVRPHADPARSETIDWFLRAGLSALLFFATRSFWLTASASLLIPVLAARLKR